MNTEITEFRFEDEVLEKRIDAIVEDKDFLLDQYRQIMQNQSNFIDKLLSNIDDHINIIQEQAYQNKELIEYISKIYPRAARAN